jgi:CubicO group peptidase (beta-lactamase class C family)
MMMQGFPPAPQEQVTLANWRSAPFNRWAFHHVRELVPSADIAHDPGRVRVLPSDLQNLPLEKFLSETDTDAMVVLHRGRVVFERYFNGMTAASPHILMSVSKSLLGLLAGLLAARGELDLESPVTRYLPEARGTGFAGATLRHLLDMRTGLDFVEDYHATAGAIVEYRRASNWNPPVPGAEPADLRSFLLTLKQKKPHGGPFDYLSPNSDLLGWVIERAAGARYADLMSELVWRPARAETSAYITVDRLGAPRAAGGVCTSTRDLARVGQWLLDEQGAWIDDLERASDREAWESGSMTAYYAGLPIAYRSQWYVWHGAAPLAFGMGIHGQNLFVDRANDLVIAKFSSQATPLDVPRMALTMRTVSQIRSRFAHER